MCFEKLNDDDGDDDKVSFIHDSSKCLLWTLNSVSSWQTHLVIWLLLQFFCVLLVY